MVSQCSHVVGAGGEGKRFATAQATTMTTLIGSNNAKVLAEFFVTGEVIEVGSCGPTV